METIKVEVLHKNQKYSFPLRKGLSLQALEKKTEIIEYDCRAADCGICIVRVLSGQENLSAPKAAEADFLRAMHAESNERLACQCRVFGPVELQVDDWDVT